MTRLTVGSKPISSFVAYTNETKTQMKSLSLCQSCETISIYMGHDAPESNQRLLTWLSENTKSTTATSCYPRLWSRNWWALVQCLFIQGNTYTIHPHTTGIIIHNIACSTKKLLPILISTSIATHDHQQHEHTLWTLLLSLFFLNSAITATSDPRSRSNLVPSSLIHASILDVVLPTDSPLSNLSGQSVYRKLESRSWQVVGSVSSRPSSVFTIISRGLKTFSSRSVDEEGLVRPKAFHWSKCPDPTKTSRAHLIFSADGEKGM